MKLLPARFFVLATAAALLPAASCLAQARSDLGMYSSLKWRSIGPVNTAGRIDDFAVGRTPGQPDAIYVATASGGVFKSTNGGTSWTPVFDEVDAMMSIGAVAVAPSSPNTVWAGTGEANNRQSSSWGDGMYKSTDAGKTWTRMGLRDTRSIARIVVNPQDANVVYVAAAGHLWGPNPDRGVFKTTDGGQTWKKTLFVDNNTGATDLIIDPLNPQRLYAAMYQHQRRAWGYNGGGPGSGVYRSTDGGETWQKLSNGLPAGDKGRIALALYAGNANNVWAQIEAAGPPGAAEGGGGGGGGFGAGGGESGLYKSSDGGESWAKINNLDTRPMYFSQVRVDPKNANYLYSLGSNRGFYHSEDGGKTFAPDTISGVHGEDHALWIDPADGNHMIIGGDGGVSITWDRAKTWDFRMNMPIGQFYEVDVDNKVPFTVCGGLQDNGVWCTASATRDRNGVSMRDAWNIGGGDGFYAKFDPSDQLQAFEESQDGNVTRVNLVTLEHENVRPGTEGARGAGGGSGAAAPGGGRAGGGRGGGYRWNWDTPIAWSSTNPNVAYMGANVLFKSTDRGSSWTAISPDLTSQTDRDTLTIMGVRVVQGRTLSGNDGVTAFPSLTTIGESPLSANVIYTGADDGSLSVTKDGGKTWSNITSKVPGLPPMTYVTSVLPSRYAPGRVYATFDGHYNDDYTPYVYVSEDYGQTWRSLTNGLPETSVNRIREHPHDSHILILAHSRGVSFSNDMGATWHSLATNMPTVPTDDAIIQPRDNSLVVGTHGRSIWILDDVTPLQTMTAEGLQGAALLVSTGHPRLVNTYEPQAWFGTGYFFAPNPQWTSEITYYLRDGATGQAEVKVTDPSGTTIRALRGPTAKGLNRVDWDLRMDAPIPPAEAAPVQLAGGPGGGGRGGRGGGGGGGGGAGGRGGNANVGPLVLPGTYNVSIIAPGMAQPLTGKVIVDGDPLPAFSDADRRTRQNILMTLYGAQQALGTARGALRSLVSQHDAFVKDLGGRADSVNAQVAAIAPAVERAIVSTGGAARPIEAWSGLPTVDQRRAADAAFAEATSAIGQLNRLTQNVISGFYNQADRRWASPVPAVPVPSRK